MTEAVIVEAVRTAIGRRGGKLSPVRPDDLLALTLREVVTRAGVDPAQVDDVIAGCVTQTGEQGMNIARAAALIAGFPIEVPGTTVNRFCGSGQQAVNLPPRVSSRAHRRLSSAPASKTCRACRWGR